MPFCGEKCIASSDGPNKVAASVRCRCWTCDDCAPDRKRQLIALAMAGNPNRLITLTSRRREGLTPAQAARDLVRAWRLIRRNFKHQHPNASVQFLAIFEQTKLGWPHLHILVRSQFIDQRWLSAELERLTDSPIVDVRAIKSKRGAAAYVSKYIAKAPGKFDTLKRYWRSLGWQTEKNTKQKSRKQWDPQPMSLAKWCAAWRSFGWRVQHTTAWKATAFHPDHDTAQNYCRAGP